MTVGFSITFIPHTGSRPRSLPAGAGLAAEGIVGIIGVMGAFIGALPGLARKRPGSASNFAAQPAPQKKYVVPPCSRVTGFGCSNTFMPHTGSRPRSFLPSATGAPPPPAL